MNREAKLQEALRWALEWIDAVPEDTELPAMPGFDRDYVNELVASPVQGAASSASGAKGAAVNPATVSAALQAYRDARERREHPFEAMQAALAATLAERAQAAQPVAGQAVPFELVNIAMPSYDGWANLFYKGGCVAMMSPCVTDDLRKLIATPAHAHPSGGVAGDVLNDLWIHEDMARDAADAVASLPRKDLKAAYKQSVEGVLYWQRRALTAEASKAATPAPEQEAAPLDPAFLADLARSRAKYPGNASMLDGLCGELHELKRAYSGDGDVRAEAFDVAVCAYRLAVEGDAGGNQKLDLIPDALAWGAAPVAPPGAQEAVQLDAIQKAIEAL